MEAIYRLKVNELNDSFMEQLKKLFAGGVVEIKIRNEVVFYDEIPTSFISKIGA